MKRNGKVKLIPGFSYSKLKQLLLTIGFLFSFMPVCMAAVQTNVMHISLKLNNATVLQALLEINRMSNNQVLFKNDEVQAEMTLVSVNLNNVTISEAVSVVLCYTNLRYTISGDVIVVSPAPSHQNDNRQPVASGYIFKGVVKDQDGSPLIGASVVIQDTTIGVTTDEHGMFSLQSNRGEATLVVSYLGYVKKYVKATPDKHMIIVLEADAVMFSEVVVTGYQNVQRERMTGVATTISASQIESKGFSNLEQALNSTISGVNLTPFGRPGQDAQIMIRGANSLTGSTAPMWIVDGMPLQGEVPDVTMSTDIRASIITTGIGNIPPDDIRSITVLKDAAATAIYGARAANGVIVIETKNGLEGKTRFSVSANFGFTERPSNNVDMMSTAQKIRFEKQILNDQIGYIQKPGRVSALMQKVIYQEITPEEAEHEIARLSAIKTDWFKEIFKPAIQQQYNFIMSGGDLETQYYASLNYLDQHGIEPNNAYNRLGMNLKLLHSPNKRMHITGAVTGTIRDDRSSASVIGPLNYAMYANPYEKPYNDDGSYAYDLSWDPVESTLHDGQQWETLNAIEDMKRNTQTQHYLNLQLTLKLEWEILKDLMFTTHGTYNANSSTTRITEGENTYTSFKRNWLNTYMSEVPRNLVRGSLYEGNGNSKSYTWRNTLQYSQEFDNEHYLTLFLGQEIWNDTGYTSYNYYPVFDGKHRVGGYPDMTGIDGSVIIFDMLGGTGKRVQKMSSFFGNASYSYMDRYIATAAIRYDGSDIIGNNNQFTPLWNVGVRWNLHRESFLKNYAWINQMSLRAGFGYTGSIDKNALPFLTMTLTQDRRYDDQLIPGSFTYPNYNVKWQTKQDFNVGMDLTLFDRRLELGINYYYNIVRDVLDDWNLPPSSGRNVIKANVADIYNNGFEIDLGATFLRRKSLQWYTKFNLALNNNKVKNTFYKSVDKLPNTHFVTGVQYVEGYPVSSWFGYKYAGIDPITGYVLVYTGNGDATYPMRLSGTEWTRPRASHLGKSIPPLTGGFSTSVNWNQFVIGINFEFKAGHKIPSFNTFKLLDSRNRHSVDERRWRQPGDITNIPQLSEVYTAYSTFMYDSRLEKGDYLRCTYLNIGYNLDPNLLSTIGFNTARISFTANNLFTLSNYKGIDPSLMGQTGYPIGRSYMLSLNLGF